MSGPFGSWWRETAGDLITPNEPSPPNYQDASSTQAEHDSISPSSQRLPLQFPEDYFDHTQQIMDNMRRPTTPFRPVYDSTPDDSPQRDIEMRSGSPLPPIVEPGPPVPYHVDLRELEYVQIYDPNLMCAICHCPFVAPVKLDCDHVFCQDCVTQAFVHNNSCPTCRKRTVPRKPTAVPKLIDRMLDELVVKCPLHLRGCSKTMKRGDAQVHVDQYCGHAEVNCPWVRCTLKARRMDIGKTWCRHTPLSCRDCHKAVIERDLEQHREEACEKRKILCPGCKSQVLFKKFKEHATLCPEAVYPCEAAQYGCDFIAKRAFLNLHLTTCPLAKLTPFLRQQKARLDSHEAALTHLQQRNSMLEASLTNLQGLLSENLPDTPLSSPTQPGTAPFDAVVGDLLSLHGSIRNEVARVSASVAELDAKATMMVMNESLRNKDEMAVTNATLSSMRLQMHFLMSTRFQSQQRASIIQASRSSESGPSLGSGLGASTSTGGTTNQAQPSIERRVSSTPNRQETKL